MGKKNLEKSVDLIAIAEFLVEDYRFSRSYRAVVGKLFEEEKKRYESAYIFHSTKRDEFARKFNLRISEYKYGDKYDEGYPITPLNADEFEKDDLLIIEQMIEPTILTVDGKVVRQGTVILAKQENI